MSDREKPKCTGPTADYCPVHPRFGQPIPPVVPAPSLDEIATEIGNALDVCNVPRIKRDVLPILQQRVAQLVAERAAGANGRNADSPLVNDPTAGQSGSDPQPEKCCRVARGRVCQNIKPCAEHPSDPQPSEQEEEAFAEWIVRKFGSQPADPDDTCSVQGSYDSARREAFSAGREYERNHRPAIDIEDIIKHCRLLPDGKSVSLPELRKALQKATGRR